MTVEVREVRGPGLSPLHAREGRAFLVWFPGRETPVGVAAMDDGRRVRFDLRRDGLSCALYGRPEPGEDFLTNMAALGERGGYKRHYDHIVLSPSGSENGDRLSAMLRKNGWVSREDGERVQAVISKVFETDRAGRVQKVRDDLIRLLRYDGVDILALAGSVVVDEVMGA